MKLSIDEVSIVLLSIIGVLGPFKIASLYIKNYFDESNTYTQKIKNVALFMIVAEVIVSTLRPLVNFYFLKK